MTIQELKEPPTERDKLESVNVVVRTYALEDQRDNQDVMEKMEIQANLDLQESQEPLE